MLAPVRNGFRRVVPRHRLKPRKQNGPFVWIELRAHGGVDAVAGDQHVAFRRRQRLPCGSVKRAVTRSAALLDAGAAMPGDEILRPDPLAHRAKQHPLQVGAKQRDVRPQMAGRLAERLAIDELAVPREEGVVLRLAGGRDQRVLQPERAQLLHRVRADMDADAERPHFGRGLEHADAARHPRGVQRQRQRRAADPAADDDRVHGILLACRAARKGHRPDKVRAGTEPQATDFRPNGHQRAHIGRATYSV